MLKNFIADCHCRGLSPQTIATYRSYIAHFLQVLEKDPVKVDTDDLRIFLTHLRNKRYAVGKQNRQGVATSTLCSYFSALSSFYDWLVWEQKISTNPVIPFRKRYLRLSRQRNGENSRQLISVKQMKDLFTLAREDLLALALMTFLAKTGLRKGELLAMNIQDLDFLHGEFIVPAKAKRSSRLGFLDSETILILQEYLECRESTAKCDALWISPTGQRMHKDTPYEIVTYYAGLLGIHDPRGPIMRKFTPHCFRHFFTTHLRRSGMSREFRMELRGDSIKNAMDIYDHIDKEELRKAYLKHVPKFDLHQNTLIAFGDIHDNSIGAL